MSRTRFSLPLRREAAKLHFQISLCNHSPCSTASAVLATSCCAAATAAIIYNIPIVRVSIDSATPHLYRGRYQAQHDAGLECMATLCLAGPASEEYFCGAVNDGGAQPDYDMARQYLAHHLGPLHVEAEIARFRDAADRLVWTSWTQQRIPVIAAALLECGTLTADEIAGLPGLLPHLGVNPEYLSLIMARRHPRRHHQIRL